MSSRLDKIRSERIEKVKKLRELGSEPYPSKSNRTNIAEEITNDYTKLEGKEVTVSGRIMSWRDFGKLAFAHLQDSSGRVQLYFKEGNLKDLWDQLKLFDIGDFVDATGTVTKTDSGETSVEVNKLRMLAKSIRPLPEKWAGLKSEEERYRRRYLDFLMNPESKEIIVKRASLLRLLREFMHEKGFLEIENPSLELSPSGAETRPFVTHINAYDMDMFLRICAGELWQKISTVGGFERVYEIARVYRNEGVDAEHNPEFTMLEFYWAYATIENNVDLHEELFARMAQEITGGYKFEYQGKTLDLTPPYQRANYNDLMKEYAKIDLEQFDKLEDLQKVGKEKKVEIEPDSGWSTTIDTIYKALVRPNLQKPVFQLSYPYVLTPLAKRIEDDERYVQMSQLILDGMEMCRIYGELNDPIDQMDRFKDQDAARAAGDDQTWGADYNYVEAMEYGMPPQTGSGIGLDRWVKVLANAETLRDTIAYPIMKPAKEEQQVSATPVAGGKLTQDFDSIFKDFGIDISGIEVQETDGDNNLSMEDSFKNEYPSAVAAYAVIEGVAVKDSDPELNNLKARIVRALTGLTKSEIEASPRLQSFREMYKNMGVDWHSRRPSPEALLRRISQGRELYSVNTMVDAYNLAVMTQQVSSGAFNKDNMKFPAEIKISKGGDEIEVIGGEVKEINTGEVCYYDLNGPYNIDYNYRDAERTKITSETKNIIINCEGVGKISYEAVLKALKLNIVLLQRFCGGELKASGIVRASGLGSTSSENETGSYPSDDKKISVVVADDLEPGIAMNTVGHLTTSIGKYSDDIMGRKILTDASGTRHIGIARYPVIILKATRKEIRALIEKARSEKVLMVDYPKEMLETDSDDNLAKSVSTKEEGSIDYMGVAICGDKDTVEKLTKKLSLYK